MTFETSLGLARITCILNFPLNLFFMVLLHNKNIHLDNVSTTPVFLSFILPCQDALCLVFLLLMKTRCFRLFMSFRHSCPSFLGPTFQLSQNLHSGVEVWGQGVRAFVALGSDARLVFTTVTQFPLLPWVLDSGQPGSYEKAVFNLF